MSDTTLACITVLGSLATVVGLLLGVSLGLARAGWAARQRRGAVGGIAAVLVIWLAGTVVLGWLDAYHGGPGRVPLLPVATLLPVIAGGLLIRRSQALWRVIEAVPQQWLVGVQVFRVVGAVFLVLWAAGRLPGAFALPAGLGDIATGLLAPLVALAVARSAARSAGALRWWNVLGLADLAVAFVAGAATTPRPAALLGVATPNVLIDHYPLVVIPAFAVPLAVVLHFASLAKLRHAGAPATPAAASGSATVPA